MIRLACRWLLTLALLAAGVVQAQAAWPNLSAPQRQVLAPLEREWAAITPAQRQKWVELANRYGSMAPAERERVQQRMTEWSRLPPQERARARVNFQESRQLGTQERQQQWEAYRALPAEQRRELAERSRLATASGKPEARAELKPNGARAAAPTQAHSVGPTVVQRGAGATTNLVSKPATPPLHQQAGLPKVAATPGFVDSTTLLPKRGAQGAAVRTAGGGEDKRDNSPQDKK